MALDFQIVHVSKSKPGYQVIAPGTEEAWAARIAAYARKGASMADCGKMCADCAFKHPQEPTEDYYEAVDGAVKLLLIGGVFNCHTDDHLDAGRLCAGMLYAKKYTDYEDAQNKEDQ